MAAAADRGAAGRAGLHRLHEDLLLHYGGLDQDIAGLAVRLRGPAGRSG
ncbi:hypothetical protein [Streptomyces sp. RPT161]|nr:hypothetical protein [Streptomyces sp. RPT161]